MSAKYLSKITKFKFCFFYAIIIILWLVAGWNDDNFDLQAYMDRYGIISSEGFNLFKVDFGFDFIEYLFIYLGFSFNEFHIIIYAIGLFAISKIILKWSFNPILVLLLYVFYHYIRDVVELRNFLGYIFMLYAINYMGKSNKLHIIVVAILLFLSFSIHMAFLLYFVFIFAERKEFRRYNYWLFLIVSILFSFLSKGFLGNISTLLVFEGMGDKIDLYMGYSPFWATIDASFLALGNGFCVNYYYKTAVSNINIRQTKMNQMSFENYSLLMYNLNSLTCIFIILTSIGLTFYARLFSNFMILNIIFFTNVIHLKKGNKTYDILLLSIYFMVFLYFTHISPFWEHLDLILNNNSLLF